jgi:DNA polymerase-3 subunit beta
VFDDSDSVSVVTGENQVRFEGAHARVVSRLIDGTFPEYRGIVPKDFKTSSYVGRTDLVRAVRSSSIFASRLQDVVLHFKSEDALHVNAVNSEVGEHHIEIATTTTGEPIRLNFNHRYLLDGLQVLGEEEIFIGCNAEHTPVLFRNKSDSSLLYVLMPIRVV